MKFAIKVLIWKILTFYLFHEEIAIENGSTLNYFIYLVNAMSDETYVYE